MGKVYVYNSGSFSEESQTGESELKIGLFFDGTANNLYNTDARKYVIYKDKKGLSEREKKEKVCDPNAFIFSQKHKVKQNKQQT